MTKTMTPEEGEASLSGLYELMIILNPELRESDMKKKLKEIEETIEKGGGKITHQDFWGKRPLAYRIKKRDEGIYTVYNAEIPTTFLKEIRDALRIDKEVVRSLVIKLPEGHVYTKFDLTPSQEPKRKEFLKRAPDFRPSAPLKAAPSKEAAPAEKGKEANKADLDKKLDEIVGGGGLKL